MRWVGHALRVTPLAPCLGLRTLTKNISGDRLFTEGAQADQ